MIEAVNKVRWELFPLPILNYISADYCGSMYSWSQAEKLD